MNKTILTMCAVAMLGLAACSKDDDKKVPSQPAGNDGIFNPACKISAVDFSYDEDAGQTWNWDGNHLADITTNGSITEFAYNGDRLSAIYAPMTEQTFSYDANGFVTSTTMMMNGMQVLNATIGHNANHKVSHLDIDIDESYLSMVIDMFMNLGDLLDSTDATKGGRKMSIDQQSVSADLEWSGDNVSRMLLNVDMQVTVTISELPRELLESQLGETTDMVIAIVGNTPIPVTIAMRDTIGYTYDSKHNPMCGFLGELNPANLSANNVTHSLAINRVTITSTLPIVNRSMSFDLPTEPMEQTYTYTYNDEDYPITCTSDEGVKTFTYLSKK